MSFPIIQNNNDLRLAYKMKYFIEQQMILFSMNHLLWILKSK